MGYNVISTYPWNKGKKITKCTFEKPVGLLWVDVPDVEVKFSKSAFFSNCDELRGNNNKWTKATLQTITGVEIPESSYPEQSGSFGVHLTDLKYSRYVVSMGFKHINKIDMNGGGLVVQTRCPEGCCCTTKRMREKEGTFEVKNIPSDVMERIKMVCDQWGHKYELFDVFGKNLHLSNVTCTDKPNPEAGPLLRRNSEPAQRQEPPVLVRPRSRSEPLISTPPVSGRPRRNTVVRRSTEG